MGVGSDLLSAFRMHSEYAVDQIIHIYSFAALEQRDTSEDRV
jgi:hypothetical protein